MKKILGIIVLGLLYFNNSIAEEYPNSWKMDINCKQGNNTWFPIIPSNLPPLIEGTDKHKGHAKNVTVEAVNDLDPNLDEYVPGP